MKKRIALFLSILMVVGLMTTSASATPPPEPVSAPVAYQLAEATAYTSNDAVVGAYVDGTYIVAYKANGAALWYQMGILNPPRK